MPKLLGSPVVLHGVGPLFEFSIIRYLVHVHLIMNICMYAYMYQYIYICILVNIRSHRNIHILTILYFFIYDTDRVYVMSQNALLAACRDDRDGYYGKLQL